MARNAVGGGTVKCREGREGGMDSPLTSLCPICPVTLSVTLHTSSQHFRPPSGTSVLWEGPPMPSGWAQARSAPWTSVKSPHVPRGLGCLHGWGEGNTEDDRAREGGPLKK